MEETETPLERLQEELYEAAEDAKTHWLKWSALMSALFAVLAAIAGLESGHSANEAMLEQIEASNSWNYYQAKGIKANIAGLKPENKAEVDRYHNQQEEIASEAKTHSEASKQSLHRHEILSRGVTFFQVAIAITAIAVMTRLRGFLLLSLALGAAGIWFLVGGWVV